MKYGSLLYIIKSWPSHAQSDLRVIDSLQMRGLPYTSGAPTVKFELTFWLSNCACECGMVSPQPDLPSQKTHLEARRVRPSHSRTRVVINGTYIEAVDFRLGFAAFFARDRI